MAAVHDPAGERNDGEQYVASISFLTTFGIEVFLS